MLAQIDGVVAPIWITELIVSDAPPTAAALDTVLARVEAETERLRLRWDPERVDWVPADREPPRVRTRPRAAAHDHIARLIADPIDLTRESPLRVTLAPLADGTTLLAIQLHHAIGDARSLMYLNRRLWELLGSTAGEPLGPAAMSNSRVLVGAARHWPALRALGRSRHRVLARRGTALRRSGDTVGAPMLRSLRIPLGDQAARASELFFAAMLAGAAHHGAQDPQAMLRLRVPVDLRRELGVGRTLENGCSAVPLELPWAEVAATRDHLGLARRLVADLAAQITAGVHWATLVECLGLGRLASAATLRSHTRPELLSRRRGSTLVTTYVGNVDRYFTACPFPVRTLRTHTPTWGANAFTFDGALVINAGAFEGLWRADELDGFVDAMRGPMSAAGLASEVM